MFVYIVTVYIIRKINNIFCTLKSFNTYISHQLFDYKITFANSQSKNTNSRDGLVLKTYLKNILFKGIWYTKINLTQIWYDELN